MAGYVENVSSPGSVMGSVGGHESGASIIGGALSGFAKVLDVGLKAVEKNKMDRLDATVGDALQPVVEEMNRPAKAADRVFDVSGDLQPWEKAQGLDKIGSLAQAHFHSPDKMPFSQVMGRASAITQELIHAHPRNATEIRERVQKILGVNPNEEIIKAQLDDEQAVKRAALEVKVRGAQEAAAAGYPMTMGLNGQPDWDSGYHSYQVMKLAETKSQTLSRELTQDKDRLEIQRLENPKEAPESEDARQRRVATAIMRVTDGPFNEIMNNNVNNLAKQMVQLGRTASFMDQNGGNPTSLAKDIVGLREQTIQQLANSRAAIARQVNNLREKSMAGGEQTTTEDWNKVQEAYFKQIDSLHDMLVTAPAEIIDARVKSLQGFQAQTKLDFLEANHTIAVLQAWLGEGNPALGSIFANTIARNAGVSLAIDKAANSALEGSTQTPAPPPGAPPTYTPQVPGQEPPVSAVHRVLGNVINTLSGALHTIPDRVTGQVLEHQMAYYGKNADKLTPTEVAGYGKSADAITRTGLQYTDVNQLGGAVSATSTPALLRTYDRFAKANPDKAHELGQNLVKLNQFYIQRTINGGLLQPTTGGSQLTFTPMYNPGAGRVEIRVTDQHGKVLNTDVRYSPTPQYNGLPAAMALHVNMVNQALNAVTHLKEHSDYSTWQDAQVKQGLVQGLQLRPGSEGVELPTDKKEKSATKPEPKTAEPDTSGWKIEVH